MRQKTIDKMVLEVKEAAHPDLRQRVADEKEGILNKERQRLESERSATMCEAQDHYKKLTGEELNESLGMGLWERSMITAKRVAAVVLTAVDIPISTWMWRTALVIGDLWALLIGMFISIGVAIGTHLSLLNFAEDPDTPLRSLRLCRSTARAAGIVTLLAALVIFLMRNASPDIGPLAALLMLSVPGALWVLSLSLPVLAGALFAWARFQARPWWYRRKIDTLDGAISYIDQALMKISDLRGRGRRVDPAASDAPPDNHDGRQISVLKNIAKGALPPVIICWAILMASYETKAQELLSSNVSIDHSLLRPSGTTQLAIQVRSCEIWDDWSTSVDQGQMAEARRQVNHLLEEFVTALRCVRIRVGRFTNEGPFARFTELELPQPPSTINCARASSKYSEIFRLFQQFEEQKAERECSARYHEATRKFNADLPEVLKKAKNAFLQDKKSPYEGNCTDIVRLLRARLSMASEDILILILTDAISDCQTEVPQIEIRPVVQVIFLLVPPDRKRISTARADEWLKMWATAVPGVSMIPWVNLTPSWIRQFAQRHAPQVGVVRNEKRE